MRFPLRPFAAAVAVFGAINLSQGALPDWIQYIRNSSGLSAIFFRPVDMPGGAVLTRRTPAETVAELTARIGATPDDAQLYSLRAHEFERKLDFNSAEQDWKEFAARIADPAEGQLALADFYNRRLRPVDEVDALLAVGRSPSPASERFTPAVQQSSWQAFERIINVSKQQLLPDLVSVEAFRSWLARYPEEPEIYRRNMAFLVEREMFDASEALLGDYASAFPTDAVFPVEARVNLVHAINGPDAALLVLESSFDPLWPANLFELYFQMLEEADRLRGRLDQTLQRLENTPDDLASVAWIFHYRRRQGDQGGAVVALQQFLQSKEDRSAAWNSTDLRTVAELFLSVNDYVDAARCRYALYSLPGVTAEEQEHALGGLVEIVLEAPEQPIPAASGDFTYYSDIATADRGPGVLNGVLSLLLNSQGLDWRWQSKQRAADPYLRRAWALELLKRFETEFPQSQMLSSLEVKAVRAFGSYGDDTTVISRGETLLSRFPDADERSEIQFLIAEAHARRGEIEEEFAVYERLLQELSQRFERVPLGPNVVADSAGRNPFSGISAPRSPDYARVLDRYVSRLASLQRTPDAVRLYVQQIAENPDDPGIYERMASFLEGNRLTDRVEGVYQQAISRFDDASWRHKLGRWYLRQQRQAEFERLTREVVDSFSGSELEGYFNQVTAGPGVSNQLYLRLNQYAYQRFPHNLTFVRNLLAAYQRQGTRNEAAWQDLIRQHWFYAADLRNQYFAKLSQLGQLDETLAAAQIQATNAEEWRSATETNPSKVQLLAEGAIWKALFEEAASPAFALAEMAPSDEPTATRATALHRSLAAFDSAHTDTAIRLNQERISAAPRNEALLTEAGDILADRSLFSEAGPYWDRISLTAPGDPRTYLASATVYWDYYLFDKALGQLQEGRRRLDQRSLFSYEAGAIEEGRNDPAAAVREYLQGALGQPPDYQARQRLVALSRREEYRNQIDQATASLTAAESPSRQAIELRIAILETMDRRDDLQNFLIGIAERVDSRTLLEEIERIAQSRGVDAVQKIALLRRIELTQDPVESRRLRIRLVQLHESLGEASAAEQVSSQLYAEQGRILGVVRERVDFLWRNNKQPEAISVLLESSNAAYSSLADQLRFEAAQKATEAERYEQAGSILNALLISNPFHLSYTAAMADLLARQGQNEELARFYENQLLAAQNAGLGAAALRSTIAALRRGMIPALNRLGRHTEVIDQYIELINGFPDDDSIVREASYYAQDHNLADRLANFYLRTVQQSPRDVRYHRVLANIQFQLERLPQAVNAYSGALAVLPNDIELWQQQSRLQERLLLFDDALNGYQKLYELSYGDPQWMISIARLHAKRGEVPEAVTAIRAALIDDRPELPYRYFSAAEQLSQWGLLEEAQLLATSGVELSGDQLLSVHLNGAQLYLSLATKLRRYEGAVERVLAARPSPAYEGWEYSLQPPFESLTQTAAEYFSPEETQTLITYFDSLRARTDSAVYEHVLLPAVRRSGPAELEARWLAADLTTAPAGDDVFSKRARLIELQQKRMKFAELGRQLEDHWEVHPQRSRETQLLQEAARAYRISGELANEFRVLGASVAAGSWQERYASLLLERNPTELIALSRRSSPSLADRTAEYVILRGDSDLAWRAVEARATGRPAVWESVYKGLAGVFKSSTDERFGNAYLTALGNETIGDRVGQTVDRNLRLAGDLWFYHAARYGEYQAAVDTDSLQDYLPAETELRPASAMSHFELGERYREFGAPDRAKAAYQIAVELDENEPLYAVRLGELAIENGDSNEAIRRWRQALIAYTDQVRQSRLGPQFWNQTTNLLERIGSEGIFNQLRPDLHSLLNLYLIRNGLFRFDGLAGAALQAGFTAADLFDLAPNTESRVEYFSTLADTEGFNRSDRIEAFSRAIATAQQQLAVSSRPQMPYRRQVLHEQVFRLIEFHLANGDTAAAQSVVTMLDDSFIEVLRSQRPTLFLRLAMTNGIEASDVLADDAPYIPESSIYEAAQELRQFGASPAADSLLEAFYLRQLQNRAFSPSYFIGLAELYLQQGANDAAQALLWRMVWLNENSSTEYHLSAASLLENAGQHQAALAFAAESLLAEPWNTAAKLIAARLGANSNALAAIVRDGSVPYALRAEAAQALSNFGGSRDSLGSGELDLLARGAAAPTDNPNQPGFYRARLIAADRATPALQVRFLADALAARPEPTDVQLRIRLFEAAHANSNHYQAIAALEPLFVNGPVDIESFDSVFSENLPSSAIDPWTLDSFLPSLQASAVERARIATTLADSLAKTDRFDGAAAFLNIAIALEDSPQRREAHQEITDQISRRAENARRRPRIGEHLDQPEIVRQMIAAGGRQ